MNKEARIARQEQMFRAQQKEIERLEAAIKRYAIWGKVYDNEDFATKAKSMQKRLDKMDKIEKPVIGASPHGPEPAERLARLEQGAGTGRRFQVVWRAAHFRADQRDHLARGTGGADRPERLGQVGFHPHAAGAGRTRLRRDQDRAERFHRALRPGARKRWISTRPYWMRCAMPAA
jgi:ATPase subunit of ABC transporter with duplicated ATPase domains